MLRLTVRDQRAGGRETGPGVTLELPYDRMTLRELLRRRIEHEVAAFEAAEPGARYRGLVQPTPEESALNGAPARRGRVDPERQVAAAVEAFERTRLLVLVDDRQVEDLDAELALRADTRVAFVKLVPLAGG